MPLISGALSKPFKAKPWSAPSAPMKVAIKRRLSVRKATAKPPPQEPPPAATADASTPPPPALPDAEANPADHSARSHSTASGSSQLCVGRGPARVSPPRPRKRPLSGSLVRGRTPTPGPSTPCPDDLLPEDVLSTSAMGTARGKSPAPRDPHDPDQWVEALWSPACPAPCPVNYRHVQYVDVPPVLRGTPTMLHHAEDTTAPVDPSDCQAPETLLDTSGAGAAAAELQVLPDVSEVVEEWQAALAPKTATAFSHHLEGMHSALCADGPGPAPETTASRGAPPANLVPATGRTSRPASAAGPGSRTQPAASRSQTAPKAPAGASGTATREHATRAQPDYDLRVDDQSPGPSSLLYPVHSRGTAGVQPGQSGKSEESGAGPGLSLSLAGNAAGISPRKASGYRSHYRPRRRGTEMLSEATAQVAQTQAVVEAAESKAGPRVGDGLQMPQKPWHRRQLRTRQTPATEPTSVLDELAEGLGL